jgi:hypothetical protein
LLVGCASGPSDTVQVSFDQTPQVIQRLPGPTAASARRPTRLPKTTPVPNSTLEGAIPDWLAGAASGETAPPGAGQAAPASAPPPVRTRGTVQRSGAAAPLTAPPVPAVGFSAAGAPEPAAPAQPVGPAQEGEPADPAASTPIAEPADPSVPGGGAAVAVPAPGSSDSTGHAPGPNPAGITSSTGAPGADESDAPDGTDPSTTDGTPPSATPSPAASRLDPTRTATPDLPDSSDVADTPIAAVDTPQSSSTPSRRGPTATSRSRGPTPTRTPFPGEVSASQGVFVTSDSKRSKYYYARDDKGWHRIKEDHQVWFRTAEALLRAFPGREPHPYRTPTPSAGGT